MAMDYSNTPPPFLFSSPNFGISLLGISNVGDSVGSCGDAGVTGVLAEDACFFFSAILLTTEDVGGSMSDLCGWSSKQTDD